MNVLIVDRQMPFTALAARLHAAGWQREADPTAPPPLIEGEPEIVEFRRAESRLRYHFEPATGMRELRITGPGADNELASLAAQLPGQGIERARDLLRDAQPESRLLGLQMVEALDGHALFEEAAALLADANPTVARQALQTCVRLLAAPTELALQSLGQWKQQHPGKSAFFLFAGSSHNKLQILRWLAHDRRASNEHIDDVLRTAFDDADWEVRLTALVVAARLRAAHAPHHSALRHRVAAGHGDTAPARVAARHEGGHARSPAALPGGRAGALPRKGIPLRAFADHAAAR
jgi:hypothetical protein